MGTGYESVDDRTAQGRFAKLARIGEVVFHAGDLANLWHITNKNTLYTSLKRYVKRGFLFRIRKGLYSVKPPEEVSGELLGVKALHGYAYVSTETVLARAGLIFQHIPYITLVSGKSKRFSLAGQDYFSRKLAVKFLYNSAGIFVGDHGVLAASAERAIADLLYFNPHAYIDAAESSLLDWGKVALIQEAVGYPKRDRKHDTSG